jgi:chemotaxis protein MotB
MEDSGLLSRNALGFTGVSLLVYALVIFALYYFAYVPKETELTIARQTADAAGAEAAAAQQRLAELEEELVVQAARISDLEGLLAETGAALQASVQEREQELERVQRMQAELTETLQAEIAIGQIRVERMLDSLRVDMVNEILFDSGDATLKPEGIEVLRRLGDVLERATDKLIVVQGHTDSVQIGGRLSQRYPTNWELSAARAINVTRLLQEQVGIDPRRLSASGFSEYRPREDNSTPEGRQKNRRIEILLAPLPETSFAQPFPVTDAPVSNQP